MGSIQKRGEGTYLLTVSHGFGLNGKRQRFTKTVTAKDDKEARKLLNKFEAEVEANNFTKPEKMTFPAFAKYWLDRRKNTLGIKTYREYERLIELRINPAFNNLTLERIRPHHLMQFYENLAEKNMRLDKKTGELSAKTIRHYHSLLSTMLSYAVKWQFISDNPAKRVEAPQLKKKEAKHLDEEQTIQVINKLNEVPLKYKLMTLIAIHSGLRRGEITGLRWSDIDLENYTITVKITTLYVHGVGLVIKEPKTEASIRTISIPTFFKDLFKLLEWEQNENRTKMEEQWHESGFVFVQDNGKPMFPDTIAKWFRKFLEKNKLPLINFHGLRHTNASLLIAQNLDLVTISKRLGHSNATTTANVYAHQIKSVDRLATEKLENMLNAVDKSVDNSVDKSKVSTKCQQNKKKAR